jgi:hypothetical protein
MQRNCENKTITKIQAAEQRTIVAHSASYGFDRSPTHQAPAGAKDKHRLITCFVRSVQGLNYFDNLVPTILP